MAMLAGVMLYAGCKSSSVAPVPMAEIPIPVVLKLVSSSEFLADYSKISAAVPAGNSVYHAVGEGGEFSEAIIFGPDLVFEQHTLISSFLDGLATLDIVGGVETTTAEGVIPFGFLPDDLNERTIKIDFGDFMFDGVNLADCSGNITRYTEQQVLDAVAGVAGACTVAEINDETCLPAHPICLRVWIENEFQLMGYARLAWVFDEPPRGDIVGQSRLKFFSVENDTDELTIAINFDHRDPVDVVTELYGLTELSKEDSVGGTRASIVESQVGPADTALKTLNANSVMKMWLLPNEPGIGDPDLERSFGYLGRYREDGDFWSGSLENELFELDLDFFQNQCAVISTGEAATDADCADVNGSDIRVGTEPFAELPTDDVFIISPDFPETPTF